MMTIARSVSRLVLVLALFLLTACASLPAPSPTPEAGPEPTTMPAPTEDPLAGTEWTLASMGSTPVAAGSEITLQFDDQGRVGGSAGCNSYGGSYTVDGPSISFGALVSTKMACAGEGIMEQEQEYLAALGSAATYEISAEQLLIHYDEGRSSLTFTKGVTEGRADLLAGTEWTLTSMGSTPPVAGSEITLQFDDQGRVGGTAGCNSYGGSYTATDGMLQVTELLTTMMACAGEGIMEQEQEYLAALGSATAYEVTDDQLLIDYNEGQATLTFTKGSSGPAAAPTAAAGEPLAGTEWTLASFGAAGTENSVVAGSEVTLQFDDQGRAGGSAGCNSYNSSYTLEGTSITFGPIASTRMACAGDGIMEQEQEYLAALGSASAYEVTDDQLLIDYNEGQATLTFTKGGAAPTEMPTATATTPAAPEAAYLDNRSTPQDVLESFVNAINRKEYLRAYSYWQDPAGTLGAFEDFENGYADTESVELLTGEVAEDAGAGQWYYSMPVVLTAHKTDGTTTLFSGCYVLHLSNPAVQATPPFVPLQIRSAEMEPAPAGADPATLIAQDCRP